MSFSLDDRHEWSSPARDGNSTVETWSCFFLPCHCVTTDRGLFTQLYSIRILLNFDQPVI